jgi:hypothetical protein
LKLKLDDHEYVIRIRPVAYPALITLSAALSNNPPSREQIEKAEKDVIEYCVSPKPCEEHEDIIIAFALQRYAEIMREISKTFRP